MTVVVLLVPRRLVLVLVLVLFLARVRSVFVCCFVAVAVVPSRHSRRAVVQSAAALSTRLNEQQPSAIPTASLGASDVQRRARREAEKGKQ